MPVVM